MELLKRATGLPFEHVPYKGGAPALNDLWGGQIPLLIITAATISPHVKAGKVVPLAILNERRSALFPDLPNVRERRARQPNGGAVFHDTAAWVRRMDRTACLSGAQKRENAPTGKSIIATSP